MDVRGLQVSSDLTKIVEIKRTDEPLRKFLIELLTAVKTLEDKNAALEARVKTLETP